MIEVSVELTTHEMGVLAQLLELPTVAGIEDNPIDDLPEAARGPVIDSVIASLEAREILKRDDSGELDVDDSVKVVMTVASIPALISIVSRQIEDLIETTFLSVHPDLGVEVSLVAHSVYRLTPFASGDLLARILRLSDLHPVAEVDGAEPVDVVQAQLDQSAIHMFEGDDAQALAALGGGDSARLLLNALKAKRSSSQVTILHKPGDGRVEGGALAWIDTGFGGIWTMEELEDEAGAGGTDRMEETLSGTIRIQSRDSRDLVTELFSYLPEAFSMQDGQSEDE